GRRSKASCAPVTNAFCSCLRRRPPGTTLTSLAAPSASWPTPPITSAKSARRSVRYVLNFEMEPAALPAPIVSKEAKAMVTPQSNGYLAQPASGSGAPVLVLHAWWGLNETISSFCDRLAGEGFLAYAPDLYHGEVTDQISRAD